MRIELHDIHLIQNNATLPLTLAEAKQHLNLHDFEADDALVTSLIDAAATWIEGPDGIGHVLMRKTYLADLNQLPAFIHVQLAPVSSVIAKTTDNQTINPTLARPHSGQFWFEPKAGVHTLEITAGYATAAEVPADLKLVIKQLVATWYQNREDYTSQAVNKLPIAADAILNKYRRY